jgi:GLPGLI family protein
MMNKNIITAFCCCALLALSVCGYGQETKFITTGKIIFEKKLNIRKETENDRWLDNVRDKLPQYKTSVYYLYFGEGKTRYEHSGEPEEKVPYFGEDRSSDDIIFTDLKQGFFNKKMAFFDETFLLSDSIRNIRWQMTNDLRDIAGFECHKAVAVVMDSIYVVAYYTDQITVSGGPLSYCNLPGMILGLAFPRLNTTIFATKVELTPPKPDKLTAPAGKMKKTDYKGLIQTIDKSIGDWGNYGRRNRINFLL